MNKLLNIESTDAYKKYNGKRVRILRHVYVVDIIESLMSGSSQIYVSLNPVTGGTTADNMIGRDSYAYEMGGRVFKKAVDFCYDIERELEDGIPVDYVIAVDER